MMLNTISVLIIIIIIISLHEVVKKFLLPEAMLSSSAFAEDSKPTLYGRVCCCLVNQVSLLNNCIRNAICLAITVS